MYIITLNLTDRKSQAADHMAAHNEWIARGFEDGVFLVVGSLKPQGGGAIIALADNRSEIESRLAADPFVREGIAEPHIQEVDPARTDARLSFLKEAAA